MSVCSFVRHASEAPILGSTLAGAGATVVGVGIQGCFVQNYQTMIGRGSLLADDCGD